jgi:1-acyl-sn-glycerol-3-phosphate acyltransferase
VTAIRSTVRTIYLLLLFAYGALNLAVKRPKTRAQRAEWLHRFSATILRAMDITVSVEGEFPEAGAVISNHVTYIDIIVYAYVHRCIYVAKAEIGSWPVIGWMTTNVGTVYVKRGQGGQAAKAGSGIRVATDDGLVVMFFPEGTTGDGQTLLPFRSGLLAQARAEQMPVRAAHIEYTMSGKNPPGATVKEDISYYDDTPLGKHIFNFLKLRGVHATVKIAAAPVEFSAAAEDRKIAAEEARAAVQALATPKADAGSRTK